MGFILVFVQFSPLAAIFHGVLLIAPNCLGTAHLRLGLRVPLAKVILFPVANQRRPDSLGYRRPTC